MSDHGFVKRTQADVEREKIEKFQRSQDQLRQSGLVAKVEKILNDYGTTMYGVDNYSISAGSAIFFPTLPFIEKHRTNAHFSWQLSAARFVFEVQLDASEYRVLCVAIREENAVEVHKQVFPVFCRELQIPVEVWWKKGLESHRCVKIATFEPRDYPPVVTPQPQAVQEKPKPVPAATLKSATPPKSQSEDPVKAYKDHTALRYRIFLEAEAIDFDAVYREDLDKVMKAASTDNTKEEFPPYYAQIFSMPGPEDLKMAWIWERLGYPPSPYPHTNPLNPDNSVFYESLKGYKKRNPLVQEIVKKFRELTDKELRLLAEVIASTLENRKK